MADKKTTIILPEAKASEYISDYVYVQKNTEMEEDGVTLKYTDSEWYDEDLMRHVIRQVERGKAAKDRDGYLKPDASDITREIK